MNNKTMRFAGWAASLAMVIVGIGMAAGHVFDDLSSTMTVADEVESQSWDMTIASYDSASQTEVWWRSSSASLRLRQATSGGYWAANTALGGGSAGNGNYYHYTEMYKFMTLYIMPGLFQQIDSVTVTVSENGDVAGWTGATKTNCSVSASGTTITVTPTDKTKQFDVYFSDFTRVTSVTVNHSGMLENLDSVTVDASQSPTSFPVGQPYSPSRLSITARDDQGHSVVLKYDNPDDYNIDGLSITGADTSTPGKKTVTVSLTYKGVTKSDTFFISVIRLAQYFISDYPANTLQNPDAITDVTASFSTTFDGDSFAIPSGYSHTITLTPFNALFYLTKLSMIVRSPEGCTYKATYSYGDGDPVYIAGSPEEAVSLESEYFNLINLPRPSALLLDRPFSLTVSCVSGTLVAMGYGFEYSDTLKTYLGQVGSEADLWDGQQIVFSDGSSKIAGAWSNGNSIATGAPSFDDGDLCLQDSDGYALYTVGRVNIGGETYYTFSDGTRYLKDNGTYGNDSLIAVEALEEGCYFSLSIADGAATLSSKSNSETPYLGFDASSNAFSCYASGHVNPRIYAVSEYSAELVAESFEENRLLLSSYTSEEGYCKDDEHGYYAKAKAVWQAMSNDEKSAVSDDGKDRLEAWAAANGDYLNGDMDLVPAPSYAGKEEVGKGTASNDAAPLLSIGVLAIASSGLFLMMHKRKDAE